MKWDFPYAIGELKPDVVVELGRFPEEALPEVRGRYLRWQRGGLMLYFRIGSPHVDWRAAAERGSLTAVD